MNNKKIRDLHRTRNEILDVAFSEIYQHGFQGVSIDDIVKKTSLTKGAFYHHFPTKLDLGYALVEDTIQGLILTRWIIPLKKFDNPLVGIKQRLRELIGAANPDDLAFGCPLNNLIQEMSAIDSIFHKKLQNALNLWISGLEQELQRGIDTGFIKKTVRAREAAVFIVMAHEGFYATIKALGNQNQATFKILYAALENYLNLIQQRK